MNARVVETYGPTAAAGVAPADPLTADARPGTAGLTLPRTRARIAVEGFADVDVLPGRPGTAQRSPTAVQKCSTIRSRKSRPASPASPLPPPQLRVAAMWPW